jgi:hypothetical protein
MFSADRQTAIAALALLGLLVGESRADITLTGSFGPYGDIAIAPTSPNLTVNFGTQQQGLISGLNAYLNVTGVDYSGGSGLGNSADLSNGPPGGIGYTFSETQPTVHQLLLSYTFTNNTGSLLPSFQFLQYTDADIGPNFADESATINGISNTGGTNPHTYQVGNPDLSSIFTNLGAGTLNNVNDFPSFAQAGDVSIAIGFYHQGLGVGESATFQVLLSDDGSTLGNFSITQNDPVYPSDSLTISAFTIPEPSSWLLMAAGLATGVGAFGRFRLAPDPSKNPSSSGRCSSN